VLINMMQSHIYTFFFTQERYPMEEEKSPLSVTFTSVDTVDTVDTNYLITFKLLYQYELISFI